MPRTTAAGLRRAVGGAMAALAAVPLAVTVAAPAAQAADSATCIGTALTYFSDTAGKLYKMRLASPATNTAAFATKPIQIGTGWNTYGRIIGGPDGRIYGISAKGVFRYRYNGTSFDTVDGKAEQQISTGFTQYATAAFRDKITIDERGDFYLIDGRGDLRWYRYDEQTRSWPTFGRVLAGGWDKYNLLVASSEGTLVTRTPAGALTRHHYDPDSQRWIERDRLIGSGWGGFTKGLFSMGGDTVFGVQADGDLFHYRWREDTKAWAFTTHDIGDGFQVYTNVTANSGACSYPQDRSPQRPATPLKENTPVAALQAPLAGQAAGDIHYAFTNTIGQLMHGRQPADVWNGVSFTGIGGSDAFTGQPTLVQDSTGAVRLFAQNITSDLWMRTQATPESPSWKDWVNLSGAMVSTPTALRLSDTSLAVFGVSADGQAWVRPQDGPTGEFLPWQSLGGTGLTATVTAVALADRKVALFAADATGALFAAVYADGALTKPWTALGGSGFTGRPSAVLMPGYLLRLYARGADGAIVTQVSDAAGTFPGTWQPVGDNTLAGTGTPSAVLNTASGRLVVFSRTTDNQVAFAQETAQGSGVYGDWSLATTSARQALSEPTAFMYQSGTGKAQAAFVVRDENSVATVWTMENATSLNAAAATSKRSAPFERHPLPKAAATR
jgi:hypothetical protein